MKQTDIKGYRNLTEDEVNIINKIKAKGEELALLIDNTRAAGGDIKWINQAELSLKTGMMYLTRSIAKPNGF